MAEYTIETAIHFDILLFGFVLSCDHGLHNQRHL